MKMTKAIVAGLILGGVVFQNGMSARTAHAGDLYTIRTSDNMLRKFDTNSLTFSDVGQLGIAFDFGDMAWDSRMSIMYLTPGRNDTGFYTIDLTTAKTTYIGEHGLVDLFSLVYDPVRDTVFAAQSTDGRGLYEIDPLLGTPTWIGQPTIWADDFLYDPVRQSVVASFAGVGDLYDINVNDGSSNLIYNGKRFDSGGLAFDADSGLYWMIDWEGNVFTFAPMNGFRRSLILNHVGPHDALASTGVSTTCLQLEVDALHAGTEAHWNVSGATPHAAIAIGFGHKPGQSVLNRKAGFCEDFGIKGVNRKRILCRKNVDGTGRTTCAKNLPAHALGIRMLSQASEQTSCNELPCISTIDNQIIS